MAGLIVGFPFDTSECNIQSWGNYLRLKWLCTLFTILPCIAKVRFQDPTMAGRYHSTLHAIATIIREERFIGLYKGITSPLVRPLCVHNFQSKRVNYSI